MDTENSYRDNNNSIIDSEDSNDSQTSHFSGCSSVASNESSSKKRKLDQRSLIWSHFTKNITNKKANCNYCTKSYNMSKANGSTDNLWNHYNRHHTKGNIIVPSNAFNVSEYTDMLVK